MDLLEKQIKVLKLLKYKTKTPSISDFATTCCISQNTDYIIKINEIENKVTDHNHDKYITTTELNKLTAEKFAAKLAQANLATKSNNENFVSKTDFDEKLKKLNKKATSNKTKHFLAENELKKTINI